MAKAIKASIIPDQQVMNKIYLIRERKVMLDEDLAELYQVETKVLNQAEKEILIDFHLTLCSNCP
jgi:DNA-binding XRE family transcriptional regulator